jgi:DNA topoisomerase IB
MQSVTIAGSKYLVFGKVRGHQSNKWNRATKLAYRFNELNEKFRGIVKRGIYNNTEHSRCALALLLMMHTGIRVGNEGSAEGYMTKPHPYSKEKPKFVKTYGLTTITWDHVTVLRNKVVLLFTGKKSVSNSFTLYDKFIRIAFKALQDNSQNNCTVFGVTDYMLTKFIKKYVGKGFTPKDFRCMKGNLYAWEYAAIINWSSIPTKKLFKKELKHMYEFVAGYLNNTPAVCKRNYVCNKLEDYLGDKTSLF